jgi:tRNA A-37 threonylcarbamoyl transferase component Bud32
VRYCPFCEREFLDIVEVCPTDGTPLSPAGERRDALVGSTIGGRYQVVRKLGEGDTGTVYLAEQMKVRRTVLLKILREDTARDQALLERFRREARVMARLDPRYVTMVHDLDQTDDGRLFIVMEYVEGRTLREMLEAEGALRVPRALALGIQVAEGLRGAHGAGVLHGNLTPRAIMVLGDDSVKLGDFGLETAPASERADLGALGAVLYEMLTGATPSVTAAGAGTSRPPRLRARRPFVPDSLDALVMRMLEADPEQAPPSLAEVIRGLGAAATEVARRIESGEVDRAGVAPLDASPGGDTVAMPAAPHGAGPAAGGVKAPRTGWRRLARSRVVLGAVVALGVLTIGGVVASRWGRAPSPSGPAMVAAPPGQGPRDTPLPTPALPVTAPALPVTAKSDAPALPPRDDAQKTPALALPSPPVPVPPLPAPRKPPATAGPVPAKTPAPSASEPKGAPDAPSVAASPPVAARSGQIRAAIQDRLRGRGLLREGSGSPIGLTVDVARDGTVTLTGILNTGEERDRAVALAQDVPGVVGVRARVNVRESWKDRQ